ncbi:EamA family transporter [Lottiidibacillus patelloidae]|uniref:EamA family transporter n=1 Tax=Lottiidibacillus patelloidae TaxID=2670334 RepID=A0A263BVT6_9BACI|nr:DMT family transporter [Lottiidibacillus patelloidae]OZM57447.1 EamA family transporter [Lottiidibacillus patelloidae]
MNNKTLFADSSLLFVAFIWGTTFVLVQNAIDTLPPLAFNAVRFFIAAACLIIWLVSINRKKQVAKVSLKIITSGVILGILLFAGYAFQTIGLLYTTTSKAAFITGLSVVLVPIFSLILFKQKPQLFPVVGIFLALIGLYLLTMINTFGIAFGDLLVLGCAISFALHIIYTGYFAKKHEALMLTVIQITTVSILSFTSSLLFEDWKSVFSLQVLLNKDVMLAIGITSFLATALAFFIQTSTQQYTTPTKVGIIFAMEPVFAALTAFLFTSETLGKSAIIGCFLIFLGMILAELPAIKKLKRLKQA